MKQTIFLLFLSLVLLGCGSPEATVTTVQAPPKDPSKASAGGGVPLPPEAVKAGAAGQTK